MYSDIVCHENAAMHYSLLEELAQTARL